MAGHLRGTAGGGSKGRDGAGAAFPGRGRRVTENSAHAGLCVGLDSTGLELDSGVGGIPPVILYGGNACRAATW